MSGWRGSFKVCLAILVSMLGTAPPAFAEGFQISPDATSSCLHHAPEAAFNSSHNQFLVIWQTSCMDGQRDINAQRLGIDGTLVDPWFCVYCDTNPRSRSRPAIAYNATDDQYLVVWRIELATRDEIRGCIMPWKTPCPGPELIIASSATDEDVDHPTVAWNSNRNQYVVVWEQQGATASIHFRILNSDGTLGAGGIVADNNDRTPDVAYNLATDEYLVVWSRSDTTVYGRRIQWDGSFNGAEFSVGSGDNPSVTTDGQGVYAVAWQSWLQVAAKSESSIAPEMLKTDVKFFSSTDPLLWWDERNVDLDTTYHWAYPDIAYWGPGGRYAIAVIRFSADGRQADVFGDIYRFNGNPDGTWIGNLGDGSLSPWHQWAESIHPTMATGGGRYLVVLNAMLEIPETGNHIRGLMSPIFVDGFDSGDFSMWSSKKP